MVFHSGSFSGAQGWNPPHFIAAVTCGVGLPLPEEVQCKSIQLVNDSSSTPLARRWIVAPLSFFDCYYVCFGACFVSSSAFNLRSPVKFSDKFLYKTVALPYFSYLLSKKCKASVCYPFIRFLIHKLVLKKQNQQTVSYANVPRNFPLSVIWLLDLSFMLQTTLCNREGKELRASGW